MALQEFVGAVSLEVDGREYEVTKVSVKTNTGRKLVKTMNRRGRSVGFARGVIMHDISISAVIPVGAPAIDWGGIEGAKITLQPVGGGQRTSYLDCFTVDHGEQYQADGGEATIDISMSSLRRVLE